MKQKKLFFIVKIFLLILLTACSKTGHDNSLLALTEFPGYLEGANLDHVEILKEETVPSGVVLLYRYPAFVPDSSGVVVPDGHCVAVTFVSHNPDGSWQAQSSSQLGCGRAYSTPQKFEALYTVGGNIQSLSTAFGVSGRGHAVEISWEDGAVTAAPLENNSFILSRPGAFQVQKIVLLDENGAVLESQTWP